MAQYTKAQREGLLSQRKAQESVLEFSTRIGVSTTTVYNWMRRESSSMNGSFAPLEIRNNLKQQMRAIITSPKIIIEIEGEITSSFILELLK
jgi:transposase-like protein